jgi:hypothetical protein
MKTVRILEIDGGGIRGILPNCVMEQFCIQAGIKGNELWKYFDIIVGTSIGGISALGYSFGLSPTDIKNLLLTNGPLIFPYDTTWLTPPGGTTGPANSIMIAYRVSTYSDPWQYGAVYDNRPLLAAVTNALGGTTKMFQAKTNTFITSVLIQNDMFDNFKNYVPKIFSNVITPYTTGQNYFTTDVAMATSAAPAYFTAWAISSDVNPDPTITNLYIDGGLYQNNGTALGYAMSKILYPGNNRLCILSLGTGLDKGDPLIPTPDSLMLNTGASPNAATDLPVLLSNSLSTTVGTAQEAVSKQFEIMSLYGGVQDNLYYCRLQTILDPAQGNQLDNAQTSYTNYLQYTATPKLLADNQLKISAFIENARFN